MCRNAGRALQVVGNVVIGTVVANDCNLGGGQMKKIALATLFTVLAAAAANAQPSGNTSATQGAATATVASPIVLTHNSADVLNFGTFTIGTGGTVAVDTSGVGSFGGNVRKASGSGNSPDAFSVEGDPNRTFTIITSGGSVSNGTDTIPFTTLGSGRTGTLDGNGATTFKVGGLLRVSGSESRGEYTGSYVAIIAYN
jgi:hypothetical protein